MARTDPRDASGFAITPITIQEKEFRVSRLGGYKMADVDAFLDEVTEAVGVMQAEIERLRAAQRAPLTGVPDPADAARQADEIIARARSEAARIAASARASAVAITDARPDDAVRAFLDQERSFLRELGEVVQHHAAAVKDMAKASRGAVAPARAGSVSASTGAEQARPSADAGEAAAEVPAEPEVQEEPEVHAEPRVHEEAGEDAPDEHVPPAASEGERTIRLDEPVGSSSAPEGSLRELFWGTEEGEGVRPSEG